MTSPTLYPRLTSRAPSGTEKRSKALGSGDGILRRKYCEANGGRKRTEITWPSRTDDGTITTVMVIDRECTLKTYS